jgi:hypothetical protein
MERLRELLGLFNDEATRAEMTGEELAELLTLLQEQGEELLEGDVTDEVLAELDEIAASADAVRDEVAERETAAAANAERAAELADRIRGQADGEDGEGDGEDGEETGAGEGDDETSGAGEDGGEETEGSEAAGESGETEGTEGEETDETEGEEAIAAAGQRNAPYRPRVTRVAARRPQTEMGRQREARRQAAAPLALTASANVQASGISAGQRLENPADIAAVVAAAYEQTQGYRGPRTKIPVARAGSLDARNLYGDERFLSRDPQVNEQRIEAVTSLSAIVAAGGRCVPSETRYDLPTVVGSDGRPVRDDMMVRFGADRGGVVTRTPATLADLVDSDAVGIWTEANDQDPSDPATKPCLTVVCGDDSESVVAAVTKCLQFGNFRARFDPESVQEWTDLAGVHHARTAETRLLTAIGTGSTQVTSGQLLGAARDVLTTLDRAQATMRSRHRMDRAIPLVFGFPFWLYDMLRTDIARQIPVGTLDETLALAEAEIDRWFTIRNVRPVGFLDGETGQTFGAQGDGALLGWPTTVVTYLYPEGSWLFLDGGTLDLGIVRDSTLNSTNDFQMFAETFEEAHFHGTESLRLTMDLCPDGGVASTVDIDPCSTGS